MTNVNLSTAETATTTADDKELYFAQPYAPDGTGFYFSSYGQFCELLQASHHEEYELQCLTGTNCELWKACGINMANLTLWFDCAQELEDHERIALFYLCDDLGYNLEDALDKLKDTRITEGTAKDYAYELVEDCGMLQGMPEHLQHYFDYEALTRDMVLNGDVTEFMYNGTRYVATQ